MTPEGKVKKAAREMFARRGLQRIGADPVEGVVRGSYFMTQNMGLGVSGLPDFIGSLDGKPFGAEAKAPNGKATTIQLERHDEMRATGWLIFLFDDVKVLEQEMFGG